MSNGLIGTTSLQEFGTMYDHKDPRATLASDRTENTLSAEPFDAAEYVRFHETVPQHSSPIEKTWLARAQNMVIAYTQAQAGCVLERSDQPDEYAVLAFDTATGLEIDAGAGTRSVAGGTLSFVSSGTSTIRVVRPGTVIRIFTSLAQDLAGACANAGNFQSGHGRIAPVIAWPDPPDGRRIRTYSLDVAPQKGRFGRIWRCTTLMVNVLDPWHGPRDPARLSPHHHDNFEQCSLALSGEFVHHLRWPWTVDKAHWRLDDHEACGSPSVAVIPPPSIHTTEACGTGANQLVDIFSPPRLDFSQKPGWVLNAADYPVR